MKSYYFLQSAMVGLMAVTAFSSCQKENKISAASTSTVSSSGTATVSSSSASVILVSVNASSTGSALVSKDSVFVVNACPPGGKRDSVAFSSLPAAIGTYLTANYAGYTFKKAFKAYAKSGSLDSYAVTITYNGKPVGLKFDASGNFVSVLEQREKPDLNGQGWHPGGIFDGRGGQHQDSIALSALPSAIKTYFTAHYGTDTLLHAVENKDSTYIVFSKNKGLFATSFSAKFVFINRIQLDAKPAKPVTVAQANLPAAIATYLTATYPGYVFDKAFSQTLNGAVDKYVVLIEAGSTRYAVEFDSSGKFIKAITIK